MANSKRYRTHEGEVYVSVPEAARLLGTTTAKLKEVALKERLEFQNFRVNGSLWIRVADVNGYLSRHGRAPVILRAPSQKSRIRVSPLTEANARLLPRILK